MPNLWLTVMKANDKYENSFSCDDKRDLIFNSFGTLWSVKFVRMTLKQIAPKALSQVLQCDHLNRATPNKVNQSEHLLRTKDGTFFRKQAKGTQECKQWFNNKNLKPNKVE